MALSVSDVTNELAAARREFRRLVMTVLREQCATDEEFAHEVRALGRRRASRASASLAEARLIAGRAEAGAADDL